MNTIGVAYYQDGTQGLIDLPGLCKRSYADACAMHPRAIATTTKQKWGMKQLAVMLIARGIVRVDIRYMDGRLKEPFWCCVVTK